MSDFLIGGLYFSIEYADEDRLFPVPQSFVFLGKNLENQRPPEEMWYFQDTRSFCLYGPWAFDLPMTEATQEAFDELARKSPPTKVRILNAANLKHMVDCEGLARAATEWATRRGQS